LTKHYHLIGIGGIGMSGIAALLSCKGLKVTGSDLKESKTVHELRSRGININIGHSADNIKGADVVIYSSAIKEDNPELKEAVKKGMLIKRRAQALADLMCDKTIVTVTGSHGKTTTSSLASYMLLRAGLNPTIAVGGVLKNIDANACFGSGEFFVAEADESDGTFLHYNPDYSIITNIDREHLDHYKSFSNAVDNFGKFIATLKTNGCLFYWNNDQNLVNLALKFPGRKVSFGIGRGAGIFADNIAIKGLSCQFDCYFEDKFITRFFLNLGGKHNILNALPVIALGLILGIDIKIIKDTLSNYLGAARRLEVKFQNSEFRVIDDYAHHPTEIMATLEALKFLEPGRIVAVFQPHRYSRTQLLLKEFSNCFTSADYIIITDIYAASEQPIPGIDSLLLANKVKENSGNKTVIHLSKDQIIGHLLKIKKPKDIFVMLGAGDITRISDELAERFKMQS